MEEQPRVDLKQQEWELVKRILNQLVPGLEVWAFGSRINGKAKRYSDFDLAVISQQPLPLATMAALREALDESDLPMKVDVVDWATTREPFRKIIAEHKVVVQLAKQC